MALHGEILQSESIVKRLTAAVASEGAAMTEAKQPESFAAALDGLARWMDNVEAVLVRRGEVAKRGDGKVQRDLRRVARVLREDPDLDAMLMDAMRHGPDRDPDPGEDL